MAKVTFTEGTVSGLACDPGKAQTIHWDAKADGLGCRVTNTGAKAYVFQGRLNGATLRVTIGSPNAWPLKKAQTDARRLQTLIDQGIDPRHERQDRAAAHEARRQEDKQRSVTFGEAWADYTAARRHTWGERHAKDHAVMIAQKAGKAP
ncbi:MAG: Arm DNA-binding domain-containing protein, partial [Immundisolibacter sp.]|uniref:Arm DNA-binding domain-containing protein n=1 Tax=Immundisolibacter sp. TaxID=1934948 RepID=UPI003EE1D31C